MSKCSLHQQRSNEIIGDRVHPKFPFDDPWREAAQDVEREVGLELAIMEFDLPAAGVEFGNGRIGEGLFIEQ